MRALLECLAGLLQVHGREDEGARVVLGHQEEHGPPDRPQRKVKQNEPLDNSANEIFHVHIKAMVRPHEQCSLALART